MSTSMILSSDLFMAWDRGFYKRSVVVRIFIYVLFEHLIIKQQIIVNMYRVCI